jgi:hypothetical protein
MNWKKPSNEQYPPFKKIVLGLQLPNKIELVKLDRIDESGPVFHRAYGRGLLGEFISIFGNDEMSTTVRESVKIDMYAEIDLPAVKEEKKAKADQPINS